MIILQRRYLQRLHRYWIVNTVKYIVKISTFKNIKMWICLETDIDKMKHF